MKHRNILKRFLALLSALTMSLAIIPATVFAEEVQPAEDVHVTEESAVESEKVLDTTVAYVIEKEDGSYDLISSTEIIPYSINYTVVAEVIGQFVQVTSESAKLKWQVTLVGTYGFNLKNVSLNLFCREYPYLIGEVYLSQTVTGDGGGTRKIVSGESRTFSFPGEIKELYYGWTGGSFTCNADNEVRPMAAHTDMVELY